MSDLEVSLKRGELRINGRAIPTEHVVESAFAADGKVIVLYDADVYWQGFGTFQFGQFENLVALDPDGKKIWTAELPTNYPGDCYYEMRPGRPLVAYSWQSYICKIDIDTGKIVDREFTK